MLRLLIALIARRFSHVVLGDVFATVWGGLHMRFKFQFKVSTGSHVLTPKPHIHCTSKARQEGPTISRQNPTIIHPSYRISNASSKSRNPK